MKLRGGFHDIGGNVLGVNRKAEGLDLGVRKYFLAQMDQCLNRTAQNYLKLFTVNFRKN